MGKKVFAFLGRDDQQKELASAKEREHMGEPGSLAISVNLPSSREAVIARPFAHPTEYGLGAHGWVTFRFAPCDGVPTEELKQWIEESYRAVTPKLIKFLDGKKV